jgi:hypothetical protein
MTEDGRYKLRHLRALYRKQDLCRSGEFRHNHIVRIGLNAVPAYRRAKNSAIKDKQLKFMHTYTRSLFRITHIPGDREEIDGHEVVLTAYFLEPVFEAARKYIDGKAVYPNLAFETQEVNKSASSYENPHSFAFYKRQIQGVDESGRPEFKDNITGKDAFHGFQFSDLLKVDRARQNKFWDFEGDFERHNDSGKPPIEYTARQEWDRRFKEAAVEHAKLLFKMQTRGHLSKLFHARKKRRVGLSRDDPRCTIHTDLVRFLLEAFPSFYTKSY